MWMLQVSACRCLFEAGRVGFGNSAVNCLLQRAGCSGCCAGCRLSS